MAKCRRCGTTFDYEKREGVCPKCCFYNRKPGMWQQEEEWVTNYNIDDNSYELPKSLVEQDAERKGHHFSQKKSNRWQDEMKKTQRRHYNLEEKEKRTGFFRKAFLLVVILALVVVVILVIGKRKALTFPVNTQEEKPSFQIETITQEEGVPEEIGAGDVTYTLGEAKVLFQEGELSEMPSGEKCIGIWLEDDRSLLNYDGYEWAAPYVYDGADFREMIDVDSLDESEKFEDISTYPAYFSYEDEAGFAVFFVNAEATSVTLSLPFQNVDEEDTEKLEYSSVLDIEIPIE